MRVMPLAGIEQGVSLQVQGVLDRFTYRDLMAKAQESYARGARYLLLDLRQTTQIELSGLFALISLVRLFSGNEPLDPEGGWRSLRVAALELNEGISQHVKLLAPPPAVRRTMMHGSLYRMLPFEDDELEIGYE
jgi:hypothetical protein